MGSLALWYHLKSLNTISNSTQLNRHFFYLLWYNLKCGMWSRRQLVGHQVQRCTKAHFVLPCQKYYSAFRCYEVRPRGQDIRTTWFLPFILYLICPKYAVFSLLENLRNLGYQNLLSTSIYSVFLVIILDIHTASSAFA